ncbi:MAG: DUF4296 domain-containing protein [Bacteroidales bacterium]|nr:DUF4296 domain-containing protein [Bacteroidales bacterium]
MKLGRIHLIISIAVVCILWSCSSGAKRPGVPSGILNEKQMEDVIYDLHKADGIMTSGVIPSSGLYADSVIYHSVYVKHNTTSEQFQKSIMYYIRSDTKGLRLVYSNVIERFNHDKAELMEWN